MSINRKVDFIRNKRTLHSKQMEENKKIAEENAKQMERDLEPYKLDIELAIQLCDEIKETVKNDPSYVTMPDSKKIEKYQKGKYAEFYAKYPIVGRYLICMGQFSSVAFNRFLLKCKSNIPTKVFDKESMTNASEDTWVQRQADYVRFLWESYQKPNFSKVESEKIWQDAYDTLNKEFTDFKKMHDVVSEKLKEQNSLNKTELIKEILARLANDEQKLDDSTTLELINKLKK